MQRDSRAYLNDILEAAAAIQVATAEINVEAYGSSRLLRSAPPWNESASSAEATVKEGVSKIERGGLHLPEMERRYAWQSTRVRGLLDSLYRGYPSGAILIWESDERVPKQAIAMGQQANPYAKTPFSIHSGTDSSQRPPTF
jgi:hypothetical protein